MKPPAMTATYFHRPALVPGQVQRVARPTSASPLIRMGIVAGPPKKEITYDAQVHRTAAFHARVGLID
jgi:hypothetical protein